MTKPDPFQLIARRVNSTDLTDSDIATAKRIWAVICEVPADATIHLIQVKKRLRHIPGVDDLLAELALLDEWGIGGTRGVTYPSSSVARWLLLRFLDRFVERGGWYPATFYRDYFGIPAGRLRQAVHDKRLSARRDGKQTVYPFEGVKRLWPNDVTFMPPTTEASETVRGVRKR